MKKQLLWCMAALSFSAASAQTYETIKKEAIVLNLKYSKMPAEPKSDRTPEFRNIYVSGVTVRDVNTPIMVVGLPEAPITGIVMRDVYIQNAKQRCVFEDCKDLVLDDVYVDGKEIK